MAEVKRRSEGVPQFEGALSSSVRNLDWDDIADTVRENPDEWLLLDCFEQTPKLFGILTSINQGDNPQLRNLGGTVTAICRKRSTWGATSKGDVWVKWEPNRDPSDRYRERGY